MKSISETFDSGALTAREGEVQPPKGRLARSSRPVTGAESELTRLRQSLARAEHALHTLVAFRRAAADLNNEAELFQTSCRVLSETGGFRLAWIGVAEPAPEKHVRIVAHTGRNGGYIEQLDIRWDDSPLGTGPSGSAIREGTVVVCRDFTKDDLVAPWRAAATERGILSSIAIPLRFEADSAGAVLTVYADEMDAFDEHEAALLGELADDLVRRVIAMRASAARAEAEAGQRHTEALLAQMIKHTPAAVAMFDRELRYLQCSDRWLTDYHLEGEIAGRSHYEVFPDIPDDWKAIHQRALVGASERRERDPFIRADGSVEWLRWEVRPWWRADGCIGGIVMFTDVITERIRTEQALHESEEMFRTATRLSPIGMGLVGLDGRWLSVNPALCEIAGYSETELLATNFQSITYPPDLPADLDEIARLLRNETTKYSLEKRYVRKDGSLATVQLDVASVCDTDGNVLRFVSQVQDISQRKADEAELKVANEKLRLTIGLARIGYWEYDVDRDRFTFDDDFLTLYGVAPGDSALREMSIDEYSDRFLPPDQRHNVREELEKALADDGQGAVREAEHQIIRADGTIRHIVVRHVAVRGAAGRTVRVYGANQDISERRRAQAALRESEERLRQLAENITEVVILRDLETNGVLYVSPEFERITGIALDSAKADPDSWVTLVPETERAVVMDGWLLDAEGVPHEEEFHLVRPDGSRRLIHRRSIPIADAMGRPYRIATVAEDITDRRQVEDQYRQAQKMEAVGQLAAGVAHDFNNILAAILMQADIALIEPQFMADHVAELKAAARRGAALTRQLLVMSRKEVLRPQLVDLNTSVESISKMLRRVLPETVHFDIAYDPEPLMLFADVGMLDQVVLNLVVNARDAMPSGGTLRIELGRTHVAPDAAGDREPGPYATLAVRDSGTGIAPDVLPRVFEPFFTTKKESQGTGLGLATVFGIVKQHRGWIDVSTAPGNGTSFAISIPVASKGGTLDGAPGDAVDPAEMPQVPGLILLVEDDTAVRGATRRILERTGYTVIASDSGREALDAFVEHAGDVSLVFTDLGLPGGMAGRDLVRAIRSDTPDICAIYTTGYTDTPWTAADDSPKDILLQKPYSAEQLFGAIARCVAARPGRVA